MTREVGSGLARLLRLGAEAEGIGSSTSSSSAAASAEAAAETTGQPSLLSIDYSSVISHPSPVALVLCLGGLVKARSVALVAIS